MRGPAVRPAAEDARFWLSQRVNGSRPLPDLLPRLHPPTGAAVLLFVSISGAPAGVFAVGATSPAASRRATSSQHRLTGGRTR